MRLIEAAIECGVTYFDTARLYGHGEAEGLLGTALRGRREHFFVASKAGILPTYHPVTQKLKDRAARILRVAPPMRALVKKPVVPQPVFGVFDPARIRQSIETSLAQLRTDYLDLLLLHECGPADATSPALVDLLNKLVEQGRIRAWGVATDPASTLAIAASRPTGLAALQVPHSVFENSYTAIRKATALPIILHSVLGAAFSRLSAALRVVPALRAHAESLRIDLADNGWLARGLLGAALNDNPDGVVLFSASTPDHIAANLKALTTSPEEVRATLNLIEYYRATG